MFGSMLTDLMNTKDLMQGKLFQKCTHLLYCSVLSPGANVNARWMSKPDTESIFHIKNQWNILVKGNYYVNYQNSMLLTSSDTKRTLMHLFLFTNSAQRELVLICTQNIRMCIKLFLHYNLVFSRVGLTMTMGNAGFPRYSFIE